MSPPKRKPKKMRDKYDITGKVEGDAVIIQGPDARVEVKKTQLSPEEIQQQHKTAELELLKQSVIEKIATWDQILKIPEEPGGNPYRFGQALRINEKRRLVGREQSLIAVMGQLQRNMSTFLAGSGGCGKTSFLQAGIIPLLINKGHLPVLVPAGPESLEVSIKRQFVDTVLSTQYLNQIPLSTFLRHVIEILPDKKRLYLLIDDSEEFLEKSENEIINFKNEWAYCIANLPRLHWLFSIHLGFSYLLNNFEPETNPFHDLVILGLLERDSAREAILTPAMDSGIVIDERIVHDLLDQLGPTIIPPYQLQTVCYILAGGNQFTLKSWDMAQYESQGRANGILQKALEQIVNRFDPQEREPVWQILACLAEGQEKRTSWAQLDQRLGGYDLEAESLKVLLEKLDNNHLIEIEENSFRLTNLNFIPRIQQWAADQAASQRAEMEAKRQIRHFRNSALRGLVGGAVGFALFDQFVYTGTTPDLFYLLLALTMTASLGGIAGFILTLSVDLAIASFRGPSKWYRYLVGVLGGMLASMIIIFMYINLNYIGDTLIQILIPALLEAAAWGAAIGLGTTWAMGSRHRIWLIAPLVSIFSGGILLGVEGLGGALVNEAWKEIPSMLRIFLAGAVMPLFYVTAVLWGRRGSKGSEP